MKIFSDDFVYSSLVDRSSIKLRLIQTALKLNTWIIFFEAMKFSRGSKKYDKSFHDNTATANFTALKSMIQVLS